MKQRVQDETTTPHPGKTLAEQFMKPLGISSNRLGAALAVPANRISEIVKGRRSISADTALRLATLFGTPAEYWMTLQSEHDLALARQENGAEIHRVVTILKTVVALPDLPGTDEAEAALEDVDDAQISLFASSGD